MFSGLQIYFYTAENSRYLEFCHIYLSLYVIFLSYVFEILYGCDALKKLEA